MRKVSLTGEWLSNWSPTRSTEVADKDCRGLTVVGGPNGLKTFYRFETVRDDATGKARRRRVRLGRLGSMSLVEARAAVNQAREVRLAELPGASRTVAQVAESYRKDVLIPNRESADDLWETVKLHILDARPDPRRRTFGEWPAREVKAPEVSAVVRLAKERRLVEGRRRGGNRTGQVVLREVKSIFTHGVATGVLEATPAGALQAAAFGLGSGDGRDRYLDEGEVRALFEALDLTALLDGSARARRLSVTMRLGIAFQLYVPTRTQSVIAARWDEVDLDAARWTIPADRLKVRSKRERAKARPFVVPLPETAVAILHRLREEAGESPWILTSPRSKPDEEPRHVEGKALIRALERLQAGGKLALAARVTVHDLRRTWRTWAEEVGVDDVVAEKCLGHRAAMQRKGFSRAADVYARAERLDQRAAAMALVAAAFDRVRLGTAATVVPLAERAGGAPVVP